MRPAATATPTREVLPNGVVLIVQEQRASEVVALQLWMRMGGRDEAAEELGLAHYIEHMLFKGTPTRPPGSIDTLIEGFGGTSNAFTSYDTTHYDFVVPTRHLRAGVELLADLAVNASFPPEEIESEKKVVFEEMNLIEDDPEKFLLRRLYEVAYSPHPYGRPLLGRREFIQKLDRDQLLQFYRKHFVPKNMVLVVVGAAEPTRVRQLVEAAFGRIQAAAPSRGETPPVPALGPSRRVDVIRKVRAEGVTEAERQRALITAESSYAFDIETAEGLAKTYGQAETTWTLDNELAYLSRLRGITAAQIQAVAKKYFGDDDYARVRFVPGAPSR